MKTPTFQIPMGARILALQLFLALSFASGQGKAQELTEADIARRVKSTSPDVLAARSAVRMLKARELSEPHPNPQLSIDREQLLDEPKEIEDTLALSIPIDLSSRRSARAALARAETQSAAAGAARLGGEVTRRALRTFYRGLAARERAKLARALVARLVEATRVSESRLSQGTSSGYDVSRIALDADLARSTLAGAEALERRCAVELGTLLGLPPEGLKLKGDLAVAPVRETGGTRPSVEKQRLALSAAKQARDSAGSAWVPQVAVNLGARRADSTSPRYGYVAGLSVELPIFSRSRAVKAEADARVEHGAAQLRALERHTKSAQAIAQLELKTALAELKRFNHATAPHVERSLRAARSAYREGEHGVTQLLDAERAGLQVAKRALQLRLRAKFAELDLRAAQGQFE